MYILMYHIFSFFSFDMKQVRVPRWQAVTSVQHRALSGALGLFLILYYIQIKKDLLRSIMRNYFININVIEITNRLFTGNA